MAKAGKSKKGKKRRVLKSAVAKKYRHKRTSKSIFGNPHSVPAE